MIDHIHGIPALSLRHRGCSSVVEHSTADREVPGSNPGAPWSVTRTQAFDDLHSVEERHHEVLIGGEVGFIGTQTHLPTKKLFSPWISATLF